MMLQINNRIKFLISLIIAFAGISGIAQAQMPVSVIPQLIPPYSLQLSSYYQGASPRLIVTLINNDLNRPGLRARLQMTIRGRSTGIRIQTAPTAPTKVFVLESGIPTQLSLNDLVSLFNVNNLTFSGITAARYQERGSLPEDIYDFCFDTYEAITGEKLGYSGCASAYITFSEPPMLNNPQKASLVKITEPVNIPFSWTPRHRPDAANPTEYTFQIVELNNVSSADQANTALINPEAAFSQQKILFEQKTNSTSFIYGPSQPMLIPGRTYAWRVKASTSGSGPDRSIFRNGGYSEVYYFTAIPICPAVSNIIAYSDPGKANITWAPVAGVPAYTVSYRKAGSSVPWTTTTTSVNSVLLAELEEGAAYEYSVSFLCGGFAKVASPVQAITIAAPVRIKGRVSWALSGQAEKSVLTGSKYDFISTNQGLRMMSAAPEDERIGSKDHSVATYGVVKLRFLKNNKIIDSAILSTDANGSYNTEIPRSCYAALANAQDGLTAKISASIPGHTAVSEKQILIKGGASYTADIELLLNTLELQLSGQVPASMSGTAKAAIVFDVLMPRSELERTLGFWPVPYSGSNKEEISYNGIAYVKVASRNDATPVRNLPALSSGNYLVRATNGASITYNAINDDFQGQKSLQWWKTHQDLRLVIAENIKLGDGRKVTGTITYNGQARKGISVSLIAGHGAKIVAISTGVTGDDGKYDISFPTVAETGLEYSIRARDDRYKLNNSTAPDVALDNVTQAGIITKDIDYDFGRVTITGRILDQNKQPMSGVLIKATGYPDAQPYANVRTNSNGFYSFFVPGKETKLNISMTAENTSGDNTSLTLTGTRKAQNINTWKSTVSGLTVVKSYTGSTASLTDPAAIGLDGTTMEEAYTAITGQDYIMVDAYEVKTMQLYRSKNYERFRLVFKAGAGKAKITFPDSVGTVTGSHNEVVQLLTGYGDFKLTVAGLPGEVPVIPFTVSRSFGPWDTGVTVINIEDYVKVSGIVTNKANTVLKNAKVYLDGIGSEVLTDSKGAYTVIIPRNKPYTIKAALEKYASYSKSIQASKDAVLNITMEDEAPAIPVVTSMGGFAVTVTKIVASTDNKKVFLLTGTLVPPGNDVFSPTNATSHLSFENVPVQVDTSDGNAIPEANVQFKETVFNLTAFGYAAVELSDSKSIYMVGMKDNKGEDTRAIGGITATNVKLKLANNANIQKTGLNLADAYFRNSLSVNNKDPEVVLVPAKHKVNGLSKEASYALTFDGSGTSPMSATLGSLIPVSVSRKNASLSDTGLSLAGSVNIPSIPGLTVLSGGGSIPLKSFTFGKSYEFKNITVDVSKVKAAELGIQRIRGRVETVSLYNIGTVNAGMSFGGYVYVKKPVAGNGADTLFIKKFEFLAQGGKPAVTASFRLGQNGIGIKGLSFTQAATDELALSYDGANNTFKIMASGTLNYDSKNSSSTVGKFSASLFPINIQRFEFGTKDWSFFLLAQANAEVKIKVATIKLQRLLVSIGNTGLNKQTLLNNLTSDESGGTAASLATGGANEMVDESNASWAVGFKGGLGFESALKGLKVDVAATMLVSDIDNTIGIDVPEIALGIDQSAFTLAAKVKLSLQPEKVGFEGDATLTVLQRGFDASFKFYKLTDLTTGDGGIEMGATFALTTPIITGPIQWFKIGGGFEFNTLEQMYSVTLLGDLGGAGTPKESMYLKDGSVKLLFNLADCGAWPVISGAGTLNIATKDWLTITAKADFCRTLLLVTLDGQIPIVPAADIHVKGVLFTMASGIGTANPSGSVFFGLNATVSALDKMLQGNAFVGLGINYSNTHPESPQEAKDMWRYIDKEVKDNNETSFNGIDINADLTVKSSGGFSIGIGSLTAASADYSINASGKTKVYYKFSNNLFYMMVAADVDAYLYAEILHIGITGKAKASVNVQGGYNNKWYLNGKANVDLQLYNDNGLNCNDYRLWDRSCHSFGYPCGWWSWCHGDVCVSYPCIPPHFKVCENKGMQFSYEQGKPFSMSLK